MGLSASLFSGITGLQAHGDKMSVLGNNIANVNTVGFKSAKMHFEDAISQDMSTATGTAQVGRGVQVGAIYADYAQGSFETTSESTDLAISAVTDFSLSLPRMKTLLTTLVPVTSVSTKTVTSPTRMVTCFRVGKCRTKAALRLLPGQVLTPVLRFVLSVSPLTSDWRTSSQLLRKPRLLTWSPTLILRKQVGPKMQLNLTLLFLIHGTEQQNLLSVILCTVTSPLSKCMTPTAPHITLLLISTRLPSVTPVVKRFGNLS